MATIYGTAGIDIFSGTAANDEASYLAATWPVTVNLTDPSGASNAGFAFGDTYISIEYFRLSNFNDTFFGLNTPGAYNWAAGMDGDDTFTGGGAGTRNLFWAGPGNDTVFGKGGETIARMGDGNDRFIGGAGRDAMYGDAGDDFLRGVNGDDYGRGGDGNDTMLGDKGNDRLYGDDGNDTLAGGEGNDFLYGGTGNDYINAGTGKDWIDGGEGNDSMRGGGLDGQVDTFVFTDTETGSDYIWDFENDVDVLRFTGATVLADLSFIDNASGNAVITNTLSGATIEVRGVLTADLQDDLLFA